MPTSTGWSQYLYCGYLSATGTAVKNETDPHLIARATGVGACLGTDFVKSITQQIKEHNLPEIV